MKFVRESIFVGAVRSFCTCFAAILGILLAILVIAFGFSLFSGPSLYPKGTELVTLYDAEGQREMLPDSAPVILQISLHGEIGVGDLTSQNIDQILLDSREGFLRNNRVKAILLNVNTPGGTTTDADGIYRSLLTYKKKYSVPIYAFVDGMCASGGMYICSAADKIYANPPSIIGSIGVIIGPMFNFSGAMEKVGVQSLTLSDGKDKDMLNPFRPWNPGEETSLKVIVDDLYQRFVSIVTTARPEMDKTKLINEYGAQVFLADTAKDLGYIDSADATYDSTLTDLVKAAGIAENEAYQVMELRLPRSFFAELAKGRSPLLTGKVAHSFYFGPRMDPSLSGKLLYLYQP